MVGLVEHGDLDVVEAAVALADEVLEPAGAGDEDVDAVAQRGDLRVLPDAAEDDGACAGRAACASGVTVAATWLASSRVGSEHEGARAARARGRCADAASAGDERQREGDGLAAAGAAAAEDVAPGEGVGQRRGLDRERRDDAAGLEDARRGAAGTPSSAKPRPSGATSSAASDTVGAAGAAVRAAGRASRRGSAVRWAGAWNTGCWAACSAEACCCADACWTEACWASTLPEEPLRRRRRRAAGTSDAVELGVDVRGPLGAEGFTKASRRTNGGGRGARPRSPWRDLSRVDLPVTARSGEGRRALNTRPRGAPSAHPLRTSCPTGTLGRSGRGLEPARPAVCGRSSGWPSAAVDRLTSPRGHLDESAARGPRRRPRTESRRRPRARPPPAHRGPPPGCPAAPRGRRREPGAGLPLHPAGHGRRRPHGRRPGAGRARRPRAARAPHPARAGRRRRARPGRRAHAGADAQPARRPRPARRQRRRGRGRGHRDRRPRRHEPARRTCGSRSLGAAVASVLVYVLGAAGRGGATPVRLALAGTAITARADRLHQRVAAPATADVFDRYRFWQVGSLAGHDARRSSARSRRSSSSGIVLALALARPLNALALGDDTGRALGAHVGRTRASPAPSRSRCCAARATAAAGPIVFVGLTVPHVARAISGPRPALGAAPTPCVLGAGAAARRRRRRPRRRAARGARGRHRHRVPRRARLHRARAPPPDRAAVSAATVLRPAPPGRTARPGPSRRRPCRAGASRPGRGPRARRLRGAGRRARRGRSRSAPATTRSRAGEVARHAARRGRPGDGVHHRDAAAAARR